MQRLQGNQKRRASAFTDTRRRRYLSEETTSANYLAMVVFMKYL